MQWVFEDSFKRIGSEAKIVGGVWLDFGASTLEGVERERVVHNFGDVWKRRHVDAKALCVVVLGDDKGVGESDLITKRKLSGCLGEDRFQSTKSVRNPKCGPLFGFSHLHIKRRRDLLHDMEILDGLDAAVDDLNDLSDLGSLDRVL